MSDDRDPFNADRDDQTGGGLSVPPRYRPCVECAPERSSLEADLLDGVTNDTDALAKAKQTIHYLNNIVHDMVVANQSAWIEWRHGEGAEAAMGWIENGLDGPGHIPDEDEPYCREAQAWYDANRHDPFPACACGRPSNHLWMGIGACCDEHMQEAMAASAPRALDAIPSTGLTPADVASIITDERRRAMAESAAVCADCVARHGYQYFSDGYQGAACGDFGREDE